MKVIVTLFISAMLVLSGITSKLNAQAPGATCATAAPITLNSCTGAQTMTDFTAEGTSPAVSCAVGTFRREGWYSFTVTAGPSQTICVAGTTITTNADLIIQIISGTCAAETQVACANASVGASAQTENASFSTGVLATATTYYVRILNYGSAVNMDMSNVCFGTIPNDNCAGAVTLMPNLTCITTSGYDGCTTQSLPAGACGGDADDDVWYTFVASSTSIQATVVGCGDFDAVAEAYSGTCGGTSIGCVNSTGIGGTENLCMTGLIPGITYWIRVYDAGTGMPSCNTFTICLVTGCSTVSIANISNTNGFNVSPNPFTNETTVIFIEEQKNTTVNIMDVLGKEVYKAKVPKGAKNFIIEKGEIKSGIYFIQITDERKNNTTAKIIITE